MRAPRRSLRHLTPLGRASLWLYIPFLALPAPSFSSRALIPLLFFFFFARALSLKDDDDDDSLCSALVWCPSRV